MSTKAFDRNTTVAAILAENPALIEVFDDWGLHLVPSTAVAMNAPLQKAAGWHAIRDVDRFLVDLNTKKNVLSAHGSSPTLNGHDGK